MEKRKLELETAMKNNILDRYYFIKNFNEFSEPQDTLEECKHQLVYYFQMERIQSSNAILIKVFIGKTFM